MHKHITSSNEHPFCISAVVTNSDESQLLTSGKMSQRQGKEVYFTPTKELLQPSLSPGTPHNHAFEQSFCLMNPLESKISVEPPELIGCKVKLLSRPDLLIVCLENKTKTKP
ncbi:hypothetical protein Q9966_012015 [Columba livia]|nr:hypothetical protein Q9966_012015 [Columba livia]